MRSRAEPVVLAAGVAVPLLFTTSFDDAFALPKLVVLWTVTVVAAWCTALEPARRTWVAPIDVPLVLYAGLTVASTVASTDLHQSLFGERFQHQGLLTLALGVGSFAIARRSVRLGPLLEAIAVGAGVVAAYAVLQQLGVDPWWDELLQGRSFSTIGQPNALAAYLVLALPVTLAVATVRRSWLPALAAAVLVAGLVSTSSRGGLAGAVVATLLTVVGVGLRRRAVAVAIVSVVVVLIALPTAGRTLWERAVSATELGADGSVRDHLDGWLVAAAIVEDHPWLGTGPETFPDQFPTYSRIALPDERARALDSLRFESPHNRVLGIAAGAGVPAAIAFVAFAAGVCTRIGRAAARSDGRRRVELVAALAALVGYAVTESFMTTEVTGGWLAWTLAGAALGAVDVRPDDPHARRSSVTSP